MGLSGAFVLRNLDIGYAILMSYIYFLLYVVNLGHTIPKLSSLVMVQICEYPSTCLRLHPRLL